MRVTSAKRTGWSLRIVLLLGVAAFLAACADVNHLREAQDSFNKGAEMESELAAKKNYAQLFGTPSTGAPASIQDVVKGTKTPDDYYADTLAKLDASDPSSLAKDKLLGTALTLRALTYWRLNNEPKALETAEKVTAMPKGEVFDRDLSLATALPGLIMIDQVYRERPKAQTREQYASLIHSLIGSKCALVVLEGAYTKSKGGPVASYILQSKIIAYINLKNLSDAIGDNPSLGTAVANDLISQGGVEKTSTLAGYRAGAVADNVLLNTVLVSNGATQAEADYVTKQWERVIGGEREKKK